MNNLVAFLLKKKLKLKGSLLGCFVLIISVITPVVFGLIIMNSMINGIADKFIYLSDGHIQIPKSEEYIDSEYILSSDDTVSGYALVYSSESTTSLKIKGVSDDYFSGIRNGQLELKKSETPIESRLGQLSISQKTAETLNVDIGDKIALMIVPDSDDRPVRPVLMIIGSIYSSGYDQLDSLLAYTNIEYATTLYPSENSNKTELILKDKYASNLDYVIQKMNFSSYSTWIGNNYSIYENFLNSRQMILIVCLLVVIIAAFFTSSTAQQLVQEESQNISILKLLGTKNISIKLISFLSILCITIVAMFSGVILGIVVSYLVKPILSLLSTTTFESLGFYLLNFSISIPWNNILLILCALIVVSIVSVYLNLRRISKISPMQLFRES